MLTTHRPLLSTVIALLLYVAAPNLVFCLISWQLGLNRSLINLDYMLAGVLFAFGWRKLALTMLGLFLLVDALNVASLVFPFVRVQDAAYLLSFVPHAALAWQLALAGVLLFFLVILLLVQRLGCHVGKLSVLLLFNTGLLLYGVKVYSGQEQTAKWYRAEGGWINSQSVFLADTRLTGYISSFNLESLPLEQVGFTGATARWQQPGAGQLNDKLLLIVVESWGVPQDPRIQQQLLQPLQDAAHHFAWLETGQTRGSMATVQAELKELCGVSAENFNLKQVAEGFEHCLPASLREQGYATTAIHGAIGIMYDRIHWYPRAGFDEMLFSESRPWQTRCYSFPGICDREIMSDYIANAFTGPGKQFVYWLTLNTHSLYDQRDIHRDLFDCTAFALDENTETCRLNKLHAQFFAQLAEVLSSQKLRGVEVLIVGDHEARMLNKDEFEQHHQEFAVGLVHLKTNG